MKSVLLKLHGNFGVGTYAFKVLFSFIVKLSWKEFKYLAFEGFCILIPSIKIIQIPDLEKKKITDFKGNWVQSISAYLDLDIFENISTLTTIFKKQEVKEPKICICTVKQS